MTEVGGIAAEQLRSFIERIERLEEEKAGIAADIRDVYAEAKGNGFDVKIMREVIKRRKMEYNDRREFDELLDLYQHALGMLDDTPLGDYARREEAKKAAQEPEPGCPQDREGKSDPEPVPEPEPPPPPPTEVEIEAARAEGHAAGEAGQKVTDNPWPASDPRRASWDDGWCDATGSTGMEIPANLRRKGDSKKKGVAA